MSPPRDYAIDAIDDPVHDARAATAPAHLAARHDGAPLTVAALYERHQASLPITETMIADACRTLRAAECVLER